MKFNSSCTIDDEFYPTEDVYVLLDEERRDIRLQKYHVRYGPGDDFQTLMDEAFSLTEFEQRKDLQDMVVSWFGERVLQEILNKIRELS